MGCLRKGSNQKTLFSAVSYLLCQQLSDFSRLDPEPQELHLQSDAALLPIHAGRPDGSWPAAALQHVSHGEKLKLRLTGGKKPCSRSRWGSEDNN